MAASEPSAHWLEVGCGTGALTSTICELCEPRPDQDRHRRLDHRRIVGGRGRADGLANDSSGHPPALSHVAVPSAKLDRAGRVDVHRGDEWPHVCSDRAPPAGRRHRGLPVAGEAVGGVALSAWSYWWADSLERSSYWCGTRRGFFRVRGASCLVLWSVLGPVVRPLSVVLIRIALDLGDLEDQGRTKDQGRTEHQGRSTKDDPDATRALHRNENRFSPRRTRAVLALRDARMLSVTARPSTINPRGLLVRSLVLRRGTSVYPRARG